ncbi:hypothetical protein ID866_5145 [Astraeus odoratus]|nr:hypothetical protein ID866_5145 [Astraeus odoratus]
MATPLIACAIAICLWLAHRAIRRKSGLPYPPGPKGLPLVGNTFNINLKEPHLTYTEWGKTYGDIMYCHIFGQDFVIINSEKTARLLADQRSSIYSNRPQSPLYRIFGANHMTPILQYGGEWKTQRKILHLSLRHDVVNRYYDLHLDNARRLLENMQNDSENFVDHLNLYAACTALEFAYGRRMQGKDDPIVTLAAGIAHTLTTRMTSERTGLLMALPILEYLPSWFPGAGFKDDARRCREMIAAISERPFAMAKQYIGSSGTQYSLVSDILTHGGVEESDAKEMTLQQGA